MSPSFPSLAEAPQATIHVVDDDAAMRRSVAFLVESLGWRAAEYGAAEQFLAAAAAGDLGCGCLVLDLRMPTMSGLELQQRLGEIGCALPIVFITGHGDVGTAVQAMKQGAVEFLEKPFKDQALLDAIAQAVRRSVAETSQQDAWKAARERFFSLTEREREVAVGLARGWSYKAIARAMGISDKTVQAHRNHLVEKLDLRSAAELAQLIMKIAPELLAES
ncbi:response regulator transcription factor [Azospira inquinata]|uniref:Response regulator transcription factor n=1 Tax=Azospira inquinata TaxID=2785627 RepID=A0A975SMA2_9RHOO|nr:response regulator [Azospira inquinata]QWT46171.1 response regulator transcription factor [Azospira inquinata]QWT48500.1 response regulator transcription factor [Azospira inquinata]